MKIQIKTPIECCLCKSKHFAELIVDVDFSKMIIIEQDVCNQFSETIGMIRQYGDDHDRSEFFCSDCLISKTSIINWQY